eukprot:2680968-Lingulodinium_polyedra.AAC.1
MMRASSGCENVWLRVQAASLEKATKGGGVGVEQDADGPMGPPHPADAKPRHRAGAARKSRRAAITA